MIYIYKLLFTFMLLIIQSYHSVNAQIVEEYEEIGLVTSSLTLARNQVTYTPPEKFILKKMKEEYLECLRSKDYKPYFPAFFNKFISKDKNCIVFLDVTPVYSKDSKYIHLEYLPDMKIKINTYHIGITLIDFEYNTGKENMWNELPLHYKTSDYAKTAFNADTVITYPLTMWKKYKKKYGNCDVVVTQKNGRCPIRLYFLTNNKGKQNLDKYIKSLERVFWYRDPGDYIDFIEPKQDLTIHGLPRKIKKSSKQFKIKDK